MSRHNSTQLDMTLSTIGHTICSQKSRLRLVNSFTTHLPYYPTLKLLKKLNSLHQPKSLREAMDVIMDIEVEHQITQPEQQLPIMETCYEETPMEETCTTEKVQMRPTSSKKGSTTTSRESFTVPKTSKCRAEELPRKSKL